MSMFSSAMKPVEKRCSDRDTAWRRGSQRALAYLLFVLSLLLISCEPQRKPQEEFIRLTNQGKNAYDRGDAAQAVTAFEQALALNPAHPDARLNLANAYLAANKPEQTIEHAREVLNLDRNSGAAYFLIDRAGAVHGESGVATRAVRPPAPPGRPRTSLVGSSSTPVAGAQG